MASVTRGLTAPVPGSAPEHLHPRSVRRRRRRRRNLRYFGLFLRMNPTNVQLGLYLTLHGVRGMGVRRPGRSLPSGIRSGAVVDGGLLYADLPGGLESSSRQHDLRRGRWAVGTTRCNSNQRPVPTRGPDMR